MPWYVLQTRTGEEEKLVEMVRRTVPGHLYGECFAVYHEQLWRRQQQAFVHVKRAFPGYVFITSKEPEALFFCLKQIPAMVKMMADDESFFLSLEPEEVDFLSRIMDENHVIGLSYLETDGQGNIQQVLGPLASCIGQLVCCRFGKRYVLVRLRLLGREKEVYLGIVLREDICQELSYGKVEAPIRVPKRYRTVQRKGRGADQIVWTAKEEISGFSTGDLVTVTDGAFRGMGAMVYEADRKAVKIGVRLFGRDMEVELPPELLRRDSDFGGGGMVT